MIRYQLIGMQLICKSIIPFLLSSCIQYSFLFQLNPKITRTVTYQSIYFTISVLHFYPNPAYANFCIDIEYSTFYINIILGLLIIEVIEIIILFPPVRTKITTGTIGCNSYTKIIKGGINRIAHILGTFHWKAFIHLYIKEIQTTQPC